ncbi:MAG: sporulation transcriptional regulator SpoIIID [Firmicutes bacterium]|nr:sporulation transcriptional regulator SpoIIID [Bacillota bacterium]
MQDYILQRVMEIAEYIMETGFTVRQTAQVFGVSKSTVHKDVTERLPQINANLAGDVRKILEKNKAERHLRGGEATRRKYLSQRKQAEQAEKVGADETAATEEGAGKDKDTFAEKNVVE